jgi:selenocysteine lyase/cysteine desulfurase
MSALPSGFESLEPFVAGWALDGSAARAARRGNSTAEERQAFYAAMAPQLPAALDLLDAKSFAEYEAAERNLMNLCMAMAHVAPAVEALGEDEPKHTPHRNEMIITRTPADA